MYSQEGGGNGQGEQEVTSPSHYIFEQFQNSYQFRILFTNPEKIFELLCPFWLSSIHMARTYYPIKEHGHRIKPASTLLLYVPGIISVILSGDNSSIDTIDKSAGGTAGKNYT